MKREEILGYYFKGFTDELERNKQEVPEGIATISYSLGRCHARVGDDIRSVDYLTEEDIIKMISQRL